MGEAKRKRDADALKCPDCKDTGRVPDPDAESDWPMTKPCPLCASLIGQIRYNAEATEHIKILGCYGYGSGGFLYAVSLVNDTRIKSQTGMSHADVLEAFPSLQCDECQGSGNSCCNGPCHKCNGDLVIRRSRFERV
jgi:ssDNA-binding Zn-finger/Zn-ribbon topoisomerase 1